MESNKGRKIVWFSGNHNLGTWITYSSTSKKHGEIFKKWNFPWASKNFTYSDGKTFSPRRY